MTLEDEAKRLGVENILKRANEHRARDPAPTSISHITLTRTICPTCGRIIIEGQLLSGTSIIRCLNCGDLYEVYPNGAIPMRLVRWQEEINVKI